jgi:hypothetical protein
MFQDLQDVVKEPVNPENSVILSKVKNRREVICIRGGFN